MQVGKALHALAKSLLPNENMVFVIRVDYAATMMQVTIPMIMNSLSRAEVFGHAVVCNRRYCILGYCSLSENIHDLYMSTK